MTTTEKFWAMVDRNGPVHPVLGTRCWIWMAARFKPGYGECGSSLGRSRRANRIAWELTHGRIADGLLVLHRCDNPPCCNPAHLFLGTYLDNNRDMTAKGRHGQRAKTHCPMGHGYSPENTRIYKGWRLCIACRSAENALKREQRAAKRAAGLVQWGGRRELESSRAIEPPGSGKQCSILIAIVAAEVSAA